MKTLHPAIHGGHPGPARRPEHASALAEHGIPPVDVVVVNLYPFEDKVAKGAPFEEAVENIDVGGPTMLRAAAKNFRHVAVVVDPADYPLLARAARPPGRASTPPPASTSRRRRSATPRATRRPSPATSRRSRSKDGGYAVAESDDVFPYRLSLSFEKVQDLRYGENPHQRAAFYSDLGSTLYSVAAARKVQGKELSFNNILDLDAAWRLVTELGEPACVIVKHTNPCGTGLGRAPARGVRARLGLRSRPRPSAASSPSTGALDADAAQKIAAVFVEAVIAPGFEPEAKKALAKKPTCA